MFGHANRMQFICEHLNMAAYTVCTRYQMCQSISALQLENAKQVALKNSDYATTTREELEGTRIKVESQSMQINSLQKQVGHR